MKKILLFSCLIILIPFLIVNIFIRDDEIKFIYHSDMVVRVKRTNGNVDNVPFEQYIIGVLAGEMPVNFELEALKAQAVASRSYVMKKMANNRDKEYDVVDTVSNQVYLDEEYLKTAWKESYVNNINKIKTAVLETNGEYLSYDGDVVEAFFFSTSVGKTENSEDIFYGKLPYLRSVESKWDADLSPVFNDNFYFTLSEFCSKLGITCSGNLKIEVTNKTSTGRVKQIKINNKSFSASDVVSKLSLRSNFFVINQKGSSVTVTTTGWGHGVGMSQYGAYGMALEGYKYDDILKHYYTGVEISKI